MIFSSPHTVDLRRHTSELRTHSADERFGSNLVLFRLGKHDFGVGIDVAGGIIFLVKLSQLLGHGLEGERLFDVLPPCISCRIRHEAEQACDDALALRPGEPSLTKLRNFLRERAERTHKHTVAVLPAA